VSGGLATLATNADGRLELFDNYQEQVDDVLALPV
jgi:hypothetical protein